MNQKNDAHFLDANKMRFCCTEICKLQQISCDFNFLKSCTCKTKFYSDRRSPKSVLHKRGLAPVISIALITLGVVVAVTLLWTFASNAINPDEQAISPDCFTADLNVVSCRTYGVCSYSEGGGVYTADILVKRGPGKADLRGIRFTFEDGLSRKFVQDANLTSLLPGYSLEELQSLRFNNYPARVYSSGPDNLVRVVPLIGQDYEVCPLASQPTKCSSSPLYGSSPPLGSIPGAILPYESTGQCCQCPRNESECYNGLDDNYPIIGGIVYNTSDPLNSLVNPTIYPYGTPIGNLSVCCSVVPPALAGQTIDGITYPSVGGSCPPVIS